MEGHVKQSITGDIDILFNCDLTLPFIEGDVRDWFENAMAMFQESEKKPKVVQHPTSDSEATSEDPAARLPIGTVGHTCAPHPHNTDQAPCKSVPRSPAHGSAH